MCLLTGTSLLISLSEWTLSYSYTHFLFSQCKQIFSVKTINFTKNMSLNPCILLIVCSAFESQEKWLDRWTARSYSCVFHSGTYEQFGLVCCVLLFVIFFFLFLLGICSHLSNIFQKNSGKKITRQKERYSFH